MEKWNLTDKKFKISIIKILSKPRRSVDKLQQRDRIHTHTHTHLASGPQVPGRFKNEVFEGGDLGITAPKPAVPVSSWTPFGPGSRFPRLLALGRLTCTL